MEIVCVLVCFTLAVQAEHVSAAVFTVLEGRDFVQSFDLAHPKILEVYLCRMPCQQKDKLVRAYGTETYDSRFRLNVICQKEVQVSIERVIKEDAGVYRVGMSSETFHRLIEFHLQVKGLCEGFVSTHPERGLTRSLGSDLQISCGLNIESQDKIYLCRDDCTSVLIHTNDARGYTAKYGLEHMKDSFLVSINNLSSSDQGRYRCGFERNGIHKCREFTFTVTDNPQRDPNGKAHDKAESCSEGGKQMSALSVVLLICVCLLLGIVLLLMIQRRQLRRKVKSCQYVNSNVTPPTRAHRPPQLSPTLYETATPAYASPENEVHVFSELRRNQANQEQTNREYIEVL